MFNYYLITFYLKYFPGNIFENSLYFALSDLLAYAISGIILKVSTTTKSFLVSYCVSTLGGILYLCFHSKASLMPIFIILCRLGNSMSFNVAFGSNARLFPTKFVATTFGLANFVAHLFTTGSPMVAEIPDPYPIIVFCVNNCLAIFAALFLKELNNDKESKGKKVTG